MANLKVGRNTFDINENDIIMFNGACWQLITREVYSGWNCCSPTVSKTLCQKLLSKDILRLVKKEREYVTANGELMGIYYYKFNIDKLNEFVNQ